MKNEISYSPFYESFISLCKERGLTASSAARQAGISSGAPTAWKNSGAVPKPAQRKKLCDFFGVDDNTLLGYERQEDIKKTTTPEGDGFDPVTSELFSIWDSSDAEERKTLLEMARFIKQRRGG